MSDKTPKKTPSAPAIKRPSRPIESPWLTTQEASDYLHVAPSTLSKFRMSKKGPPYYRLGGSVLYNKKDLDAWLMKTKTDGETICDKRRRSKPEDGDVEESD